MTTSQTDFLSEINDPTAVIPAEKRAYFQERLRLRIFEIVVGEFVRKRAQTGLTQKAIAVRLERRPEQINRWLSSPGNWTADTVSDLLLAISGSELTLGVHEVKELATRNIQEPNWLTKLPSWVSDKQKEGSSQPHSAGERPWPRPSGSTQEEMTRPWN